MVKVINPLTNRLIDVNGIIFKKLIKEGYIYENGKLVKKLNLIENILLESTPNDLLSLYLTDLNFKKTLNQQHILTILKQKYKVEGDNFIQFFKNINVKLISLEEHKTLYLYHLENTLYKKVPILKDRVNILIWLYNLQNVSHYVFGLAVTLFDTYQINTKQVALVCLYISTYMLEEYVDINDYIKLLKITKSSFTSIHRDIILKLDGFLIRPSTVFFTDNEELSVLSYFSNDLLKYKSSLIAETINYISNGNYKIYTATEFSNPCKILNALIKNPPVKITVKSTRTCAEKNKIIQDIIIKSPTKWHIGQFKKLNLIGQGVEGIVYKIKNENDIFVLKSVHNNLEPVSIEISIMKMLLNPYIIKMSGFKLSPKKVDLFLDYGQFNLYDGIMENKLPKQNFWKYLKNIVRGIDYCHYNDIIHRDLKPENIIYDGINLKLIDFGLSVPYASFRNYLDPDLAGTINYRAPECILGDEHYTTKIDIWSIGIIMYFMIRKKNLFTINAPNEIFKIFGYPKTWAKQLPLYKKSDIKSKLPKLGQYTEFFNKCTVLNPKLRSNTSSLLPYIEYKIKN